jgi:hypothetical protein
MGDTQGKTRKGMPDRPELALTPCLTCNRHHNCSMLSTIVNQGPITTRKEKSSLGTQALAPSSRSSNDVDAATKPTVSSITHSFQLQSSAGNQQPKASQRRYTLRCHLTPGGLEVDLPFGGAPVPTPSTTRRTSTASGGASTSATPMAEPAGVKNMGLR